LLLLRTVLGLAMVVLGARCLTLPNLDVAAAADGAAVIVAGGLLFMGFLTPIAAIVAASGIVGSELWTLPACAGTLFGSHIAVVLAGTMLVGILLLGPGAFSVDARMFGRREIIIPPANGRQP
jgi:hypothetical protein